jgi:NADH:ubiquinone oxidoreductase subunit 5 (subunit L)/multisubunit Na+/H+ antiporter MnhA subunit
LLISLSIGLWQDATGVNVVYSLRGVWGVALVALMGRWFGNTERQDAGTRALWFRLTGAALILLAVVLTFVDTTA